MFATSFWAKNTLCRFLGLLSQVVKMLMSTVAAVVFSFVFTTNANALPLENKQVDNLEIRVKGCPNQDNQNKQEDFDFASFISYVLQNIFGVRV